MKKLIAVLFICQSLIFIQCADEIIPTDSMDYEDEFVTEKNLETGYDIQLNKEGGGLRFCCNSNFPEHGKEDPGHEECTTLTWCLGGPDEDISCLDCALLWSEYAQIEGEDLIYQACEGTVPDVPAAPAWADGSIVGDNPHLEWGFVYSHKYKVQRKRGNGSWATITTLDNCIVDENNCQDSSYTDTSIDLDTISVNYYYQIITSIYTLNSQPSPTITFIEPLTVNISGPTSLTTLQTGTFTANVTGGLPNYTYEWWKYQDCDLRKSGGLRTPPCGSWRKSYETSNTLIIGGNVPGFNLKVIVTDQESETDFDYHYVRVTVP